MSGSDFVKIPREWIEKLKQADGNEALELVEQLQSGMVCDTEILNHGGAPNIDPEILPTLIEAIRCAGEAEMHGETAHVEFQKNPELMDALFTVADWLLILQNNRAYEGPARSNAEKLLRLAGADVEGERSKVAYVHVQKLQDVLNALPVAELLGYEKSDTVSVIESLLAKFHSEIWQGAENGEDYDLAGVATAKDIIALFQNTRSNNE